MIRPQTMSKLFLIGPKSRLEDVTSKLHELKVAHIIEHKKGAFDICPPLKSFEKISVMLVQLRSIMANYKLPYAESAKRKFAIGDLERNIGSIKKEINEFAENIKKIEYELSSIDSQKKILGLMSALNISPESFAKSQHVKSYFGFVNNAEIKDKLESISKNFELYAAKRKKNAVIALFADFRYEAEFERVLANESFSPIDISIVNGLKGKPDNLLKNLSQKRENLEAELSRQKSKLNETLRKNADYLADAEKFLSIEAEKSQAPLGFGSTKELFFIRCYIPKKDIEKVKEDITMATKGRTFIVEEAIEEDEDVPINLDNPKGVRSFEFFTSLYSLPKYDEFDPTIMLAFTFPLFFGFMLGDVGYGLITFAFFYFLKKEYPAGKYFFNILMVSSISAIVFGAIYGEFFGYEVWHGIIERAHDVNTLMIISIIAGAVQINIGLLLGFILESNHFGFLKAAYKKLSWILLQVSAVVIYATYKNMITLPNYIGFILLALSIFMLAKGEGLMGIIEIPSIISHTVSYARLMAVGLASVFIALMVNELATFLFHKGILFMPLAIIALLIGHLFNIVLGVLSPTLHSIRLHYVEFFTKFYSGGGIEYNPFGAEKQKSIL